MTKDELLEFYYDQLDDMAKRVMLLEKTLHEINRTVNILVSTNRTAAKVLEDHNNALCTLLENPSKKIKEKKDDGN